MAVKQPVVTGPLREEAIQAWNEYLTETRSQIGYRYDEIEPWAWSRLQQRLTAIHARYKATKPK